MSAPGVRQLIGDLPFSRWFTEFMRYWDYRPVTSWFEHFITINWNSGDARLEEKVLGDVGSYGLQLSRVLAAVDLLVGKLDFGSLTPEEQRTVVRLRDLAEQAKESVARHRAELAKD